MRGKHNNNFSCPIDFILSLIGDKWTLAILRDLLNGRKRTSELLRSLRGISPRTLTQRLQELEKRQLVARDFFPEIPPRVEYSLTKRGLEIRSLMHELANLGERWQPILKSLPARKPEDFEPCPHCLKQNEDQACPAVGVRLPQNRKMPR